MVVFFVGRSSAFFGGGPLFREGLSFSPVEFRARSRRGLRGVPWGRGVFRLGSGVFPRGGGFMFFLSSVVRGVCYGRVAGHLGRTWVKLGRGGASNVMGTRTGGEFRVKEWGNVGGEVLTVLATAVVMLKLTTYKTASAGSKTKSASTTNDDSDKSLVGIKVVGGSPGRSKCHATGSGSVGGVFAGRGNCSTSFTCDLGGSRRVATTRGFVRSNISCLLLSTTSASK